MKLITKMDEMAMKGCVNDFVRTDWIVEESISARRSRNLKVLREMGRETFEKQSRRRVGLLQRSEHKCESNQRLLEARSTMHVDKHEARRKCRGRVELYIESLLRCGGEVFSSQLRRSSCAVRFKGYAVNQFRITLAPP